MELGATICTPKTANCKECPLSKVCLARAEAAGSERRKRATADAAGSGEKSVAAVESEMCGICDGRFDNDGDKPALVTRYPLPKKKKAPVPESIFVCVLSREQSGDTQYLLLKRPSSGLLANQWEFPSLVHTGDLSADQCRATLEAQVKELLGLSRWVEPEGGSSEVDVGNGAAAVRSRRMIPGQLCPWFLFHPRTSDAYRCSSCFACRSTYHPRVFAPRALNDC